jgi:hydroxyethylthiazole kinase-like uncharacterized protein yjeF
MTAQRLPELSMIPVLTAAEMREWEKSCFGSGAISERVVMESAGRAAATAIAINYPEGRVVAAVGKGNNGGDAVVTLRSLLASGREVLAVSVGAAGIPPDLTHGWVIPTAELSPEVFRDAAVIVDGILGTGATGAPREAAAEPIRLINAAGRPVLALDGPSGVDLTTGAVPGEAVEASITVTFGAVKRGLLLFPGRALAGRILLAEVGFAPLEPDPGSATLITDAWSRARIPAIAPDAHKGAVGLVAVVAGGEGFGGAAIVAAMAALRAGCGGVRVFSAEGNRTAVNSAVPEAVFFDRSGDDLHGALAYTRAVAIGPGIGTDSTALALVRSIVEGYAGAFVLDADALTLLSSHRDLLDAAIARRCVLTPHPGELARLLATDTATVLGDRFQSARATAERYGCVVLAKGAPTLVAAPGEPVLVSVAGHSGVATGGMGDNLSGIVAAFLAAGASPRDAAAIGIHLAGRAAEAAGLGRGLLPRDVADALPGVLLGARPLHTPAPPFLLDLPAPA